MGAVGGLSNATPRGLTTPLSVTFILDDPNVEYSRSFQPMTQYFRIYNDGKYVLKLSYQEGESGTNFIPIYPGDDFKVYGIIAASVTLFMQSPGPVSLHIESWT